MKFIKYLLLACILLGCVGCSKSEEEVTTVSAEPEVEKPRVSYYTRLNKGVKNISCNGYVFPEELGEPEYLDEELESFKDKSIYEIYAQIHTYIDAIRMAVVLGFNKIPGESLEEMARFVAGDYEEIGRVNCKYSENEYPFLYIKNNGKYIICDPAFDIRSRFWLKSCLNDQFIFDSIDEMTEKMMTYKEMPNMSPKTVVENIVVEPIDWTFDDYSFVDAPNGEVLAIYEQSGIEMFDYCNTQFPVGLGLPELSKLEIDELIKEADYEKIAEKVNTVADAVCYITRSHMYFDPIGNRKYKNMNVTDIGNIFYEDEGSVVYTGTGPDIMRANCYQCTAGASLFDYLLYDNYPEFGYVKLSYVYSDGHAMVYVKAKDGKYYLLNPASYAVPPVGNIIYADMIPRKWLEFYVTEKGYADSLDELMEEIYNSNNPGLSNDKVKMLITFSYYGVFSTKFVGDGFNSKNGVFYFPEGSNPICHYGGVEVHESKLQHSVSHADSTGVYNIYNNDYEVVEVKRGDVLPGEN